MKKKLDETYKAFRLVREYGSHSRAREESRYYNWQDKVKGRCRLELVAEAEELEELFYAVQVKKWLFQPGDRYVQKFLVHQRYGFTGLFIYRNRRTTIYRIKEWMYMEQDIVFSHIFEDYSGDIIMVIDSWNLAQIDEMDISLVDDHEGGYDIYSLVVSDG